jgi:nucleoside-diphosphate-sugar epimerase
MSLKGKKVLITGGTGFIGANLVREVIKSMAEVHILIRKDSNNWRICDCIENTSKHIVNLQDSQKLESLIHDINPNIIYHNAAHTGSEHHQNLINIFRNNFFGTANLINACKKIDFELFVNVGSVFEYGVKNEIIREDDLLEPLNIYGISKCAATQYCQAIAKNESLPIVTLRLFTPYGDFEDSTRLIPSAIIACLRGETLRISSRSHVRDFIYIKDVIDAYTKLVNKKNIYGQIFNIGSGNQYSVGEVVEKIIELSGSEMKPIVGLAPKWSNEAKNCKADISKARNFFGWKPMYDLDAGLKKSIKWFENNIDLYPSQQPTSQLAGR